ncbi:MAG: hypothetical protein O6948_13805, partial [Deltaproteobacteria bacterium]|nr:hypothetical protein [Deltaproteobacteria bacterium]
PVLFDTGESVIPEGEGYEEQLKRILAEYQDKQGVKLTFVGHTDNRPIKYQCGYSFACDLYYPTAFNLYGLIPRSLLRDSSLRSSD